MYTVAIIKEWDGMTGFAQDGYGEMHKFTRDDVHPKDVWHLEPDFSIIIPQEGMIELSTASFSRYLEEQEIEDYKLEDICSDEQIKNE